MFAYRSASDHPERGRPMRTRSGLVVAATILAIAGPAAAQNPVPDANECDAGKEAWIFCEDFQAGNLDQWEDADGNPESEVAILGDPGPFDVSGNTVAHLRVPEGRGGSDLLRDIGGPHDRLYARWYVYFEPGFDFSAPNHGSGLWGGDKWLIGSGAGDRPEGDDRFSATLEYSWRTGTPQLYSYSRGMYMDCRNPEGACWGDMFPCTIDEGSSYCTQAQHRDQGPLPTFESGRWYCVEILVDAGTPSTDGSVRDAVLEFWIDGVSIGPWDDLWFRTTPDLGIETLRMNLFFHGDHSTAGVLMDNIVVSTERIGCDFGGTVVSDQKSSFGALKGRFR